MTPNPSPGRAVAIVGAARSPFAAADTVLARWHPVELAAVVMNAAIADAAADPGVIDEVWVGCAEPVGAQGADLARAAVLAAGWPDRVGGAVIDRAETSGTAALHAAAAAIATGTIDRAVVVGVSSASTVPPGAGALGRTYGRPWGDGPAQRYADRGGLLPAARVAELHVAGHGLTREVLDEVTAKSHALRRAAEPAPVTAVAARPGDGSAVRNGDPIERDLLRPIDADLADLPPMLHDDGLTTGASFAPPADGVAALVLGAVERTGDDDATPSPQAWLRGVGRAATDPFDASGGARAAVAAALTAAGAGVGDVARWELSEPSAAQFLALVMAIDDGSGVDLRSVVNPSGGALTVGDAAAADELRLVTDAAARVAPGQLWATVAGGPTGAAVSVWERCGER